MRGATGSTRSGRGGWPALLAAGSCLIASNSLAQEPPAASLAEASSSAATALSLPALVDGAPVGMVFAAVTLEDVLAVSAADLVQVLGARLDGASLEALRALGAGQVPADRVRETGLGVAFDPSSISLRIEIPLSLRGAQTFSPLDARLAGLDAVEPSRFAVGVTGSLVATSRLNGGSSPDSQFLFSGFTNLGGADGVNLLFGGDARLSGGSDFRRDRIVAFRDDTRRALRYSAGDIAPLQARLAGQADMLGLSIERNYQVLQPLKNVRSTGRRSLTLERRSTVEVYVNGALVQSFAADPGPIDIRDIPLADLSNDVSIIVEDDLGRRELETFSAGADLSLLGEGLSEFNAAIGLLRNGAGGDFAYSGDPVLSLVYSRGVRQNLTLSGHAVLTTELQNIGVSAAWARGEGVALVETALSQSDDRGMGAAVSLSFRGDPFGQAARDGVLTFRAEHRTAGFGEAMAPGFSDNLELDVAADYRLSVTDRASVGFGASHFSTHGGRAAQNAFAGLTYAFGPITSSATVRVSRQTARKDEVGAFLTLSLPIGARGFGYASYDTAADTARAEYRRRRSLDYPAVDWAVRALRRRDDVELGGRIGLETTRFDAVMDVSQRYRGRTEGDQSVGALRLQSGVAYVDGRVGVGRDPGRGFLMVSRHPSLSDSPVEVGSSAVGRALGRADRLGPAVIPVLAPYRPQEIRVNPLNLPPGYDIGPGGYALNPAAASGLSIQVGDDAYRIALGRLHTAEGEPIALRTGRLVNLATGGTQPFFTNAQGRVSLNRLAPGRYRLEIDVSDWVREIEVRDQDPALIDLGHITMATAP